VPLATLPLRSRHWNSLAVAAALVRLLLISAPDSGQPILAQAFRSWHRDKILAEWRPHSRGLQAVHDTIIKRLSGWGQSTPRTQTYVGKSVQRSEPGIVLLQRGYTSRHSAAQKLISNLCDSTPQD
jgi:hypothetical protein